ncbi:hypothetical protein ACUNDX_06740 [Serratia sp. IR-2025]
MTKTLTTERQQFEKWWHEEYCHLEGSSEAAFVKHVAWEAMKKARELLASREAQPVAFTSPAQLLKYPNEQKETYGQYSEKFCVPLYTAPPAPAVPNIFNRLINHLSNAHDFIENTEAFGVAAASGIIECGGAMWNIDASKAALAKCRAAMLSQPVSKGYKLVPIEPTDEQLRAMLAVIWPATYREHLRHPDNGPVSIARAEEEIKQAKEQYAAALAAALAAAPEGGNG